MSQNHPEALARQCYRKHTYPTVLEAYRFLNRRRARGEVVDEGTRAYLCKVCHKWHITSKPFEDRTDPVLARADLARRGLNPDLVTHYYRELAQVTRP